MSEPTPPRACRSYLDAPPDYRESIARNIDELLDRRIQQRLPMERDQRQRPYSYAANESRPAPFSDEPQKESK